MRRIAATLLVAVLFAPAPARSELAIGLSAGGYIGDRLYSATSVQPRLWTNPSGSAAGAGDELLVDVEGWAQFGLTGFTTIQDRWGMRFDLAFTDVDVDGKVLDPTGASETVDWEQLFVFDVIAQATLRLGKSTDSYPYLALGPSFTVASGEGSTLDQNMFGVAWGAGWRISAAEGSWSELGVRGILQWPDWAEEEDRLAASDFQGESMIQSLSAALSFGYVF